MVASLQPTAAGMYKGLAQQERRESFTLSHYFWQNEHFLRVAEPMSVEPVLGGL
jgi:hypothetical protein